MQLRRPGHTHKFVVMVMSGGGGGDRQSGRTRNQRMMNRNRWNLIENRVMCRTRGFIRNSSLKMIFIGSCRF